jgi:DNA-binding MarR family transcriptional regulator
MIHIMNYCQVILCQPSTRTGGLLVKNTVRPPLGGSSTAFLLAQVGAHAAARFAERLEAVGLTPPHAGVLRVVNTSEGMSQQALGEILRVLPSRLVVLIDELERRGFIERRDHPTDRRSYALYLTPAGREVLQRVGRAAREHEDALCAALTTTERAQLGGLLRRIADEQGLAPGVHPGFSRMRASK